MWTMRCGQTACFPSSGRLHNSPALIANNLKSVFVLPVRLHEGARAALELHFLSLEHDDRRLRFGIPIGDYAVREYVARIDFHCDRVFAALGEEQLLIAVVHVACGASDVELGLSVLPGFRRIGLGSALFSRAVMHLRNRGVRHVRIHCLTENAAIMHLARKYRMRIVRGDGESDARLLIDPPTAQSQLAEWLHDHFANASQILQRQARWSRMMSTLR